MPKRVIDGRAVGKFLGEGFVARLLHPLGDALHRPVERLGLPLRGMRRAVQHLVDPRLRQQHAQRAGAFRAQRALVDRAARIALDMDRLAVLRIDQLRAPTAQNGQMLVPTRSAWSSRGRNVRDCVLSAACAITLSPASWRGIDQSAANPATRSLILRRSFFMRPDPLGIGIGTWQTHLCLAGSSAGNQTCCRSY